MVEVVTLRVFNPNPPPFTCVTMVTCIPFKFGSNDQSDAQHCSCDWLNGGLESKCWEGLHMLLYLLAHLHMMDQVTWGGGEGEGEREGGGNEKRRGGRIGEVEKEKRGGRKGEVERRRKGGGGGKEERSGSIRGWNK